ncbi:MAG: hypothetical protein ACAI44_30160 [Candidatus Sericytochromatia bacterium]
MAVSYIVNADLLERLAAMARIQDQKFWRVLKAEAIPGPTYSYPGLFCVLAGWLELEKGIQVGSSIRNLWARDIEAEESSLILCKYGLNAVEPVLALRQLPRDRDVFQDLYHLWVVEDFEPNVVNGGEALVAAQDFLLASLTQVMGKDAYLLVFWLQAQG